MKTATSLARHILRVEAMSALFCLGMALVGSTTAFADSPLPPGAFLRQPAQSVQALNHQLVTDPLVCQRYARLYNMPVEEVREAFAHLKLTRLTLDQTFQVHYVHTGERIGYKVRRVRKGTPIYSFADGTPILVQVCGNPVRSKRGFHLGTPPPETELPATAVMFNENEALEAAPPNLMAELNGLRSVPPGTQLPPPLDFVEIPDIPAEAPTDTSTMRMHRELPVQHVRNWSRGVLLFPLAALPFLAISGDHSSPSTSAFTPPVVIPPVVIPPVVTPPGGSSSGPPTPGGGTGGLITPEPTSLWLFLAGGGGLLIPAWRKISHLSGKRSP
ncbi:MAG TPA: hypothetical protein VKU00_05045 [Chthonomonadaceae bacterium]|nr:hypothetical protein [Chthonomonadaceae bacterium]